MRIEAGNEIYLHRDNANRLLFNRYIGYTSTQIFPFKVPVFFSCFAFYGYPHMQQPESLQLVAEFHRTFKHPVLAKPSIPDEKRCKLRVDLLTEELKEFEESIAAKDMVGIADALCDIQ